MNISEAAIFVDGNERVEVTGEVLEEEELGDNDLTVLAGVAMAELSVDMGVEVMTGRERR